MASTQFQKNKLKYLLEENKVAILLEIILVLLPLYMGLIISDKLGQIYIKLPGDLTLLGGPWVYLGALGSLCVLWLVSRIRAVKWNKFGLSKPNNWIITILKALGVALAIFVIVAFVVIPLLNTLPNISPRDMSRFAILTGHLPNLIINILLMWVTAGFLEEILWRGYLITRLMDVLGSSTQPKIKWFVSASVSAVIFGLAHAYQGVFGVLKTGLIGFVFSLAFLMVRKNLWPLIIAHAFIDSLDFISHYFGN